LVDFNLLIFVSSWSYDLVCDISLRMLCAFIGRRMCILQLLGKGFCKPIRCNWSIILLMPPFFLLIFCPLFKVGYENLLLFCYVFPFYSSIVCLIYVTLPMSDAHVVLTVMSFWGTNLYYQYIIFCLISCDRFCITYILYEYGYFYYILLAFKWNILFHSFTFSLCLDLSTKYFDTVYYIVGSYILNK
jgi:hypothetical protein